MNNFYEKIEDYLMENLHQEDKKAFETELSKDSELRQEVDNQRFIIETLRQSKLREKVKSNLAASQKEAIVRTIAPTQWRKSAAMIGVFVSIGVAFWLTRPSEKQQDVVVVKPTIPTAIDTPSQAIKNVETPKEKDWLKPENSNKKNNQLSDIQPIKKRFEEPESGIRDIANTEKSKGLNLAERFFDKSTTIKSDNENLNAGIQFLKEKKYDEASKILLKIEEDSPEYGESQWFLALSLLARDRYQTAMNILEDISNQEKNPFQAKAKELYSELLE